MTDTRNARVDHIALNVRDINWYVQFLFDAFGMKITSYDGPKSQPNQVWLDGGIQLIHDPALESASSHLAHIAIRTYDLENVIDLVVSLGGIRMAKDRNWLQLPDGLCLELLQGENN